MNGNTSSVEHDDNGIVANPDMCHHCFDALLRELLAGPSKKQDARPKMADDDDDSGGDNRDCFDDMNKMKAQLEFHHSSYVPPAVDCPLFVTWSKLRSGHCSPPPLTSGASTPSTSTVAVGEESLYDLRGCIGTLSPRSLTHALSEFAITSAFHDTRFGPISLHELPLLRVGVSLLVKYEDCTHCLDWTVGVHGIIIQFESHIDPGGGSYMGGGGKGQKSYRATFLPEVASENRWTQMETVAALVRKSGYYSDTTKEFMARVRCTRYQSSKIQLSYREYAAARGYQDGAGSWGGTVETLLGRGINDIMSEAAMDEEATRQRGVRSVRPCINL